MDQATADRITSPAPTLPRRGGPVDSDPGRFSPLSAPQREAVDAFLDESRPWALRQARRSYRHLPESLREQAVDRAFTELRTRAPQSLERRALSAQLAERLTEALRHVHVGWCLNESSALLRREGTEPVQPEVRREGLAQFVEEGLGGLERAVLQLEIGAGRDTRASRAALRLGPRQYATHRDAGLSKLNDAIAAQVVGRACDQHVSSIIAAATGDKSAMDALGAGPDRCRYCAREAQGLRSVLHERLAVAPWPVAIKPAGLLVTKLGAVGALLGGKGAGAGSAALGAAGSSGASAAATVLAAAALATGTAAIVEASGEEDGKHRKLPAAQTADRSASAGNGNAAGTRANAAGASKASSAKRAGAANATTGGSASRDRSGGGSAPAAAPVTANDPSGGAPASAPAPAVATTAPAPAPTDSAPGPVSGVADPVTGSVEDVTDQVAGKLPPAVGAPVDQTVDAVNGTVGELTQTVDGLLKPKP